MTDTPPSTPRPDAVLDLAERIANHLLRYPSDLIDSRRLLRQFQASVDDFQRALVLVDQHTPPEGNE